MSEGDRAERLRQARAAAGLTQQQVANALGVDKSTVYRWETGVVAPRERLQAAASLYGVTEAWIMYGEVGPEVAKGPPPYPAWATFQQWLKDAPEGRMAEPWMIDSLRAMRVPEGLHPTLETYKRLLFAMLSIEGDSDD